MNKTLAKALAILAASATLVGLGPSPAGALAHRQYSAPAPSTRAAGFPVTIHSGGYTTAIDKRPTRILCLSASATQMLYDIGAGSQVVGVDKYSTYPANAPRTKLTGAETSAESYLHYKPDLVVVAYNEGSVEQQLAKLAIPDLVLPPASSLADVYTQLRLLGEATGHRAPATASASTLAARVKRIVAGAGTAGKGQTYFLELSPPPSIYTATSQTFVGAELALFGMKNVADKAAHHSSYPEVSAEYILAQDPDWVFLADTVCCQVTVASFDHRPGFNVLLAVKDGHVVGVNDSWASQWGPHTIIELTTLLARKLKGQ